MKLWKRKWVINTFSNTHKEILVFGLGFFMSIFKGIRSLLFFTLISIDVCVKYYPLIV